MSDVFCAGSNIKKIVDSLPPEEAEHMHRVGILVNIFTETIFGLEIYRGDTGWNGHKYFGEAAFYHDVGKAWVPRELLTKPGRLTEEETSVMHRHPEYAKLLFDKINNDLVAGMPLHLIRPAYNAAVFHHERWDGKGYPYGIGVKNIPLIARITSICDAYDTMTSNRPYAEARARLSACRELEANAGTQFDPLLIRAFLDNETEFSRYLTVNSCL